MGPRWAACGDADSTGRPVVTPTMRRTDGPTEFEPAPSGLGTAAYSVDVVSVNVSVFVYPPVRSGSVAPIGWPKPIVALSVLTGWP